MKLDWDDVQALIQKEIATHKDNLCSVLLDIEATQFMRGQIAALKWAAEIPKRQEEEDEFERQREKAYAERSY
jgi:hypothetical protein